MGTVRPCAGCGEPVQVTSPNRRWHEACYGKHRSAVETARRRARRAAARQPRFCEDCPVSIDDRPSGARLCKDCARRRNYAVTNAWYHRQGHKRKAPACTTCGIDISERRSNSRFCALCAKKRNGDRRNAHRARRRAKGWGFARDALFRAEIFARDGFVCHICGLPTSKEYSSDDPQSPVVDHLIPLVLPETPGHVWENTACAHRWCNSSKAHRVRPEDWDLYRRLRRRKQKET